MPEFAPGEAKVARAPITVRPAGLSCQAEVFLGPNEMTKVATSGLVPFTSTGASQNVHLPVIMPTAEGTYHVYIDVYIEGILIAAYRAIEDVVIGIPVPLAPCVYCGATFTTEAGLISHMEANHPGKPYLVYAYPEVSQIASGGKLSFGIKAYSTTVPLTERPSNYAFSIYIPDFPRHRLYNEANFYVNRGALAGFYEGTLSMWVEYLTGTFPYLHHDIPPGVYRLYSRGIYRKDIKDVGWVIAETFWQDVDTGQIITVV